MLWDNEHCVAVVAATEEREKGGGVWWLLIVSRSPRGTPCPATQPWRWWHIVYVRRIYGIIRTPAATCWAAIRWERRGVQWRTEKMGLISATRFVVLRKRQIFCYIACLNGLFWEKKSSSYIKMVSRDKLYDAWHFFFTYHWSPSPNSVLFVKIKIYMIYIFRNFEDHLPLLSHIFVNIVTRFV